MIYTYVISVPVNVKMPSLSPTMSEGSIVQWSKKEGEEVAPGDVLCEVQTDKAVVALETDEEGTLAKIIVNANEPGIKVGDLIALIAGPGEDWKEVAASAPAVAPALQSSKEEKPAAAAAPQPAVSKTVATPKTEGLIPRSSAMGPAVRALLHQHNLNASQIPATGPHGQLLKGDVMAFIAGGGACTSPTPAGVHSSPATAAQVSVPPAAAFIDIPLTNMRQTIAKRLTFSKSSIPHTYVRGVASLDHILALRKNLKSRIGLRLSVNDMIIKACALALRMVPEMNATSNETTGTAVLQTAVDICMAVATPSGLITPILFNADITPVSQLSQMAVALAKRARDGKLQPREFQGGSFTISNLGMFDISEFTAVINPPQVAILAVGTGRPKAVSVDAQNGVLFSNRVTLTLSVDSRFVSEVVAGRFLSRVSQLLGEPHLLLSDDPLASAGLQDTSTREPDAFDVLMLSNQAVSAVQAKPTQGKA
ncbi:Dihydrolipoamide acetyltransferase component of pyruvate dehydrogenase complex [Fasciola hepatica]|uniref:Dihydrolipoamide acetyltransferase component of pyruvate dehydrogenase complex n=1 Tax=Fasciola hepatica TaxID=6192 RepID=A0A4E0R6W4_FASHE|nr:Dihydrolipoamide acetyltransferase component of pyruvate dehydrogenase complex [Fasciola hepatica]